MAALNGHVDSLQLLLDLGASVTKVTVEDGTTIDLIGDTTFQVLTSDSYIMLISGTPYFLVCFRIEWLFLMCFRGSLKVFLKCHTFTDHATDFSLHFGRSEIIITCSGSVNSLMKNEILEYSGVLWDKIRRRIRNKKQLCAIPTSGVGSMNFSLTMFIHLKQY